MVYQTYILYSKTLNRYYTGSTGQPLAIRLYQHNIDHKGYTGKSNDWKLVFSQKFDQVGESRELEQKIKKRGARRYLADISA